MYSFIFLRWIPKLDNALYFPHINPAFMPKEFAPINTSFLPIYNFPTNYHDFEPKRFHDFPPINPIISPNNRPHIPPINFMRKSAQRSPIIWTIYVVTPLHGIASVINAGNIGVSSPFETYDFLRVLSHNFCVTRCYYCS